MNSVKKQVVDDTWSRLKPFYSILFDKFNNSPCRKSTKAYMEITQGLIGVTTSTAAISRNLENKLICLKIR